MLKKFIKEQDGMGTIEVVIIFMVLVAIATLLFRPYAGLLYEWFRSVIMNLWQKIFNT